MDRPVSALSIRQAVVALAILVCMPYLPAAAQSMADPTQPPPSQILAPSGAGAVDSAPPVPQGVQSILISDKQGGRRVAVINGETVRPGDKIDGAILVRITPTEVVLRRGKRFETLKLFPATGSDATTAGKR